MSITILDPFYAISENANFKPIFIPFPGFDNLNDRGEIISFSDSNGKPDTFVPAVNSDLLTLWTLTLENLHLLRMIFQTSSHIELRLF